MSLSDSLQDLIEQGAASAKGAVSHVAVEQFSFVREFCRLCDDGAHAGYHELNGGNASMRLIAEDVERTRPFFYTTPGSWVSLEEPVPDMAGEFLLVTGAGKHLRNVTMLPRENVGIIEIGVGGGAWRIVWGLEGDGRPTSEIQAHVAAHAVRKVATRGRARVLYHAHPAALVAASALWPVDARAVTRIIWRVHTEAIVAVPEGVGVLDWMVPGSAGLGKATAEVMKSFGACLWRLHGVFVSGEDCDQAFGIVQTLDKAADICLRIVGASGALNDDQLIPESGLRVMAETYHLPVNEGFFDE